MEKREYEQKFKKVLLETFKTTIEVLERNNITWWATAGTAIGAVRHKNIIPWDDDIDIWVPREDYNRMLTLRNDFVRKGLTICAPELDEKFYLGPAKIYNTNTTIWEYKRFPYLIGVFIDIFPIERTSKDVNELESCMNSYRLAMKKFRASISHYDLSDYLRFVRNGNLKTILYRMIFRNQEKKLHKQFLDSLTLIKNDPKGCYMVTPTKGYGTREHCPAEWFQNSIIVPFADFEIRLPSGYNEYLTQVYGDYMQLPPADKQVSNHPYHYCNLSERLTIEEVRKRLKNGETIHI